MCTLFHYLTINFQNKANLLSLHSLLGHSYDMVGGGKSREASLLWPGRSKVRPHYNPVSSPGHLEDVNGVTGAKNRH